jgi:hypothetical protein
MMVYMDVMPASSHVPVVDCDVFVVVTTTTNWMNIFFMVSFAVARTIIIVAVTTFVAHGRPRKEDDVQS